MHPALLSAQWEATCRTGSERKHEWREREEGWEEENIPCSAQLHRWCGRWGGRRRCWDKEGKQDGEGWRTPQVTVTDRTHREAGLGVLPRVWRTLPKCSFHSTILDGIREGSWKINPRAWRRTRWRACGLLNPQRRNRVLSLELLSHTLYKERLTNANCMARPQPLGFRRLAQGHNGSSSI